MKKKIAIFVAIFALIGCSTVFASSVKKYLLTEFISPIVVDHQKYNNDTLPILSYQDNTYVPLAEMGKLFGKKVSWNTNKTQIEIQNDTFFEGESNFGGTEAELVKIINGVVKAFNDQDSNSYFSYFTKQAQKDLPTMPKYTVNIVNHFIF